LNFYQDVLCYAFRPSQRLIYHLQLHIGQVQWFITK
jgi:hypothetical protein